MTTKAPNILIRPWRLSDSAVIGRILAQGWKQAYSGFMPEEELGSRIDPEHRKAEIENWLSTEFNPQQELLLVAEHDAQVVGFIGARIEERDGLGAASKIPLLYVAPELQRSGMRSAPTICSNQTEEGRRAI